MEIVTDIKKEKKASLWRFIIHISLISLLSVAVIILDVLLLINSKLDYIPNLIVNIIATCLLIVILIFYFINIFPLDRYYLKFYKGVNETTLEHHRRLKFIKEIDSKDIDKVTHRVLQFSYMEGENLYVENLYVLDSEITFDELKVYKIDTYHNVIIKYEVI